MPKAPLTTWLAEAAACLCLFAGLYLVAVLLWAAQ